MFDNMKQWLSSIYEGIKDTLVGFYESIVDVIVGIWELFLEIVKAVCDWILDTIAYLCQIIWDFFFHEEDGILWWLLEILGEWAEWFLDQFPVLDDVLGQYSSPISTTMTYVSKLDKFFPITEAVSLLLIFIVFLGLFLAVKLVLKLIPTIG